MHVEVIRDSIEVRSHCIDRIGANFIALRIPVSRSPGVGDYSPLGIIEGVTVRCVMHQVIAHRNDGSKLTEDVLKIMSAISGHCRVVGNAPNEINHSFGSASREESSGDWISHVAVFNENLEELRLGICKGNDEATKSALEVRVFSTRFECSLDVCA